MLRVAWYRPEYAAIRIRPCPPRQQRKVCVPHAAAGMTLCKTAWLGDVDMRRSEAAQRVDGRCALARLNCIH